MTLPHLRTSTLLAGTLVLPALALAQSTVDLRSINLDQLQHLSPQDMQQAQKMIHDAMPMVKDILGNMKAQMGDDFPDIKLDEQGLSDIESQINKLVQSLPDMARTISSQIPAPDTSSLETYADVSQTLSTYEHGLDLVSSAQLQTSNLSHDEQVLITDITKKFSFELSRDDVRTNELKAQIKELRTRLAPLGTQTISDDADLQRALFGELRNIRDGVLRVSELHDATNGILREETN
jgi:hypothetical protein